MTSETDEERMLREAAYAMGYQDGMAGCDCDVTYVFPSERDSYKLGWAEGVYAAKRERELRA